LLISPNHLPKAEHLRLISGKLLANHMPRLLPQCELKILGLGGAVWRLGLMAFISFSFNIPQQANWNGYTILHPTNTQEKLT
jgi:hypothetical protein